MPFEWSLFRFNLYAMATFCFYRPTLDPRGYRELSRLDPRRVIDCHHHLLLWYRIRSACCPVDNSPRGREKI